MYRTKLGTALATAHLPQPVSHLATSSVAAADAVGRHLGGTSGAQLTAAAHTAFATAMGTGMRVSAVVALAAAIGAAFALPARGQRATVVLPGDPAASTPATAGPATEGPATAGRGAGHALAGVTATAAGPPAPARTPGR